MANVVRRAIRNLMDRKIRSRLRNPRNIEDLLREVLPDLAAKLDFKRLSYLDPKLELDDGRFREVDLRVRIPYLGDIEPPITTTVIVEHQTNPDLYMTLRAHITSALIWLEEWTDWEKLPSPKPQFRPSVIIPIAFHTGDRRWVELTSLPDLLGAPDELLDYVPNPKVVLWSLKQKAVKALLGSGRPLLQALAVVRAQRPAPEQFRETYESTLRALEETAETDPITWREWTEFVLGWTMTRRPEAPPEAWRDLARQSQARVKHSEEVEEMASTVIEEMFETAMNTGHERGREVGRVEGIAIGMEQGIEVGRLESTRNLVIKMLEKRFGPLAERPRRLISRETDLDRLESAVEVAWRADGVDEVLSKFGRSRG